MQQYYVIRFARREHRWSSAPIADAAPVAALTELGGYKLTWAADSQAVYWTLGPSFYRVTVAERFEAGIRAPEPFAQAGLVVASDRLGGGRPAR